MFNTYQAMRWTFSSTITFHLRSNPTVRNESAPWDGPPLRLNLTLIPLVSSTLAQSSLAVEAMSASVFRYSRHDSGAPHYLLGLAPRAGHYRGENSRDRTGGWAP